MNQPLFYSLLASACTAASYTTHATAASRERPNIIYILADDLGYGDLGCYGQKRIETPNIDKLASEGMLFTNYYSGSPVSAPSRATLMTGLHTGHCGIRGNDERTGRGDTWDFQLVLRDSTMEGQQALPPGSLTFTSLLQKQGYATGAVGKWGLGSPGSESLPNHHGFDFFYGYNCQRQAHTYFPSHLWRNNTRELLDNRFMSPHRQGLDPGADPLDEKNYEKFYSKNYAPDLMHIEAMRFLAANKSEPFFLYYATPLPHVPLQAPKRLVDYYLSKPEFKNDTFFNGGKTDYYPTRYRHASYAAMVTYIDENVGEIVDYLKKNDLYDNTIIIVTSDNGPTFNGGTDSPWFNSGGLFKSEYGWGKCFLHEGGIRVPLIVSWKKGIKPGKTSDLPCAAYDMFATICDLSGTKNPAKTDGISLYPTLTGKPQKKSHEFLYWEFFDVDGQQALRMGKWKAMRKNMKKEKLSTLLFNLETDIQEQTNVAAQHPDIVRKMEEIMTREHTKAYYPTFRLEVLDGASPK